MIAVGATIYAIGVASWALRAGLHPDYVGQVLPGTLCTGIGVGLTLPTFMATGASALPPQAFATGSAVVNMLRQVGLAVGVSVFVAVVGSPRRRQASLTRVPAWLDRDRGDRLPGRGGRRRGLRQRDKASEGAAAPAMSGALSAD